MSETLIRNVRRADGRTFDLRLRDGRIAAWEPPSAVSPGTCSLDAGGRLALPGLVDAHAHLDKTLWGLPWHPHRAGPSLADKISNERAVLESLDHRPEHQSARLLGHMVARGTTHVRSHVDIEPGIGLRHFHALLEMREHHREWVDLQLVAFPQCGVVAAPGTLDLLEAAVREGAEVIGSLDPMGIDRDPRGQLDGLFEIADRHGVEIDIHLHDRGELGAVTLEMIAERAGALGLRGRVTVSHAFCLGSVSAARLEALIELLLEHDIAIMSHAPSGGTPFPPLATLAARGVRLLTGSDGVRDTWGPLNTGDMLERAFLLAYLSGFRDDPGLELALHMATHGGARALGATDYGLDAGCTADLVLVEARTEAEAVVAHPHDRIVFKRGRLVARSGRTMVPMPETRG